MAVLLAGCGSDGTEEIMQDSTKQEPTQSTEMESKITKENLVGVWRSGDYFLSISADGYMAAYLSNQFLVTGDFVEYHSDDEYFYVVGIFWGTEHAVFHVAKLENQQLKCTIDFSEYDGLNGHYTDKQKELVFEKTTETPIGRTNELVGKSFSYPSTYKNYSGKTIAGVCEGSFIDHFQIRKQTNPNEEGVVPMYYRDNYIYMPPFIYYIEFFDDMEHQPVYHETLYPPCDVIKRRIEIGSDGMVMFIDE